MRFPGNCFTNENKSVFSTCFLSPSFLNRRRHKMEENKNRVKLENHLTSMTYKRRRIFKITSPPPGHIFKLLASVHAISSQQLGFFNVGISWTQTRAKLMWRRLFNDIFASWRTKGINMLQQNPNSTDIHPQTTAELWVPLPYSITSIHWSKWKSFEWPHFWIEMWKLLSQILGLLHELCTIT